MTVAIQEMILQQPLQRVWNIVTDLENYQWRSDINRIEVVNDKTFIEYSNEGIATHFTITTFDIGKRYEFDIENSNMKGHWIGLFEKTSEGVKFTCEEHVEAKRMIMKPFIKKYLKLQQSKYSMDLMQAFEK